MVDNLPEAVYILLLIWSIKSKFEMLKSPFICELDFIVSVRKKKFRGKGLYVSNECSTCFVFNVC